MNCEDCANVDALLSQYCKLTPPVLLFIYLSPSLSIYILLCFWAYFAVRVHISFYIYGR